MTKLDFLVEVEYDCEMYKNRRFYLVVFEFDIEINTWENLDSLLFFIAFPFDSGQHGLGSIKPKFEISIQCKMKIAVG